MQAAKRKAAKLRAVNRRTPARKPGTVAGGVRPGGAKVPPGAGASGDGQVAPLA